MNDLEKIALSLPLKMHETLDEYVHRVFESGHKMGSPYPNYLGFIEEAEHGVLLHDSDSIPDWTLSHMRVEGTRIYADFSGIDTNAPSAKCLVIIPASYGVVGLMTVYRKLDDAKIMIIAPDHAVIKRVRLQQRMKLSIPIKVRDEDHSYDTRTMDISTSGLSFEVNSAWGIKSQKVLHVQIPTSLGTLSIDCEVARVFNNGKNYIVGCSALQKEVMEHVVGILKKDHKDALSLKVVGSGGVSRLNIVS